MTGETITPEEILAQYQEAQPEMQDEGEGLVTIEEKEV